MTACSIISSETSGTEDESKEDHIKITEKDFVLLKEKLQNH